MRKILLKLLTGALIVCTFIAGLVACSSSTSWEKPTLTNWGPGSVYGGFVGETSNYVYFINGLSSNTEDNTFGAPVKGALMVQDKSDLSKAPQVVVPKLFVATDYNAGLYIFDGRVYYGTPSTDKTSSGSTANTEMTFMSTKLDGTDTVSYFTISALSTEYRIIENDGMITPSVEKSAPKKPLTLYPTKVDALTAIGPGVDSAIATISSISSLLIHFFFSAISFCIRGIIAYPPPKVNAPIFKKAQNREIRSLIYAFPFLFLAN